MYAFKTVLIDIIQLSKLMRFTNFAQSSLGFDYEIKKSFRYETRAGASFLT